MKFLFVVPIVLIVLMQCNSSNQIIGDTHVNNVIEVPEQNPPIDIKGHWTLIKIDVIEEKQSIEKFVEFIKPYIGREAIPPVYKDNDGLIKPHSEVTYFSEVMKDLVFSGDSILGLDYPLELLQRNSYFIEADLLQIGDETIKKSIELTQDKDTVYFSYLDHYGLFIEETYAKTSYDESVLNILKLYKTNFPHLAGTWKLIREEGLEYGAYYELDFPYEILDTIVLTREELESTLYTDRSYNMLTSGKKQKYFLKYYDSELRLIPDDWYKEIDPNIHFRRVKGEKSR